MALKGTLQDFSLADILQLIGIQRKTGILTLRHGGEVVTVSFVEGNVVGAESLHRRLEDRLGTVLVKSGRLETAQLQEALKIQKNTLQRLGDVLVTNRFIDATELRDALQIQISQMVHRLFRWKAGEYDFSQADRLEYDKNYVTPMSAESLLMEGARIIDEWPMIEQAIKSFSAVYRRANVEIALTGVEEGGSQELDPAGGVTLSDEERQIFDLLDGKGTVQGVVERSSLSEFETCRILYELITRDLVEEVRTAARGEAPAAPAVKRRQSPVILGLTYMVLVVIVGGSILGRAQASVRRWSAGQGVGTWLAPVMGAEEIDSVENGISLSRLQRLEFALHVYYLLNRSYPSDLRYLVTTHLVADHELGTEDGHSYQYSLLPTGYSLSKSE